MRLFVLLLAMLLGFGAVAPGHAGAACHEGRGMVMRHDGHHQAPRHDAPDVAACIGCATALPAAPAVAAVLVVTAALPPLAAPVCRLEGLRPTASAPPPRILG